MRTILLQQLADLGFLSPDLLLQSLRFGREALEILPVSFDFISELALVKLMSTCLVVGIYRCLGLTRQIALGVGLTWLE